MTSLEDTCNRQTDYINQLEEYANSLEAANAQLMPPQVRIAESVQDIASWRAVVAVLTSRPVLRMNPPEGVTTRARSGSNGYGNEGGVI